MINFIIGLFIGANYSLFLYAIIFTEKNLAFYIEDNKKETEVKNE